MYVIVDDQPVSIDFYDHIFDAHFLGLEIGEIILENKSVPSLEVLISFSIIRYERYSGLLLVVYPLLLSHTCYLLDCLSIYWQRSVVSQDLSVLNLLYYELVSAWEAY